MLIDILSLFPAYFESPLGVSMLKRAQEKGLVEIRQTDIRSFAEGKHAKVDDRPYGGGPGMVLMPGPVCRAVRSVKKTGSLVIHLSPQGKVLTAQKCEELSHVDHLILLCGHYEGIDERAQELEVDEYISIGDYVLTNGCVAALVLLDAVIRFIPGVLGHGEGARSDSFQDGLLEGPIYTRPEIFEEKEVPKVLLQGNHAEIAKWRKEQALKKTAEIRPELVNWSLDKI